MKQVFLIAWREYRQYVFSRGFVLFLLMFPIGLIAMSGAMGLIERSKPVRTFVVYDETGRFTSGIDNELERRYLFDAISAWDLYFRAVGEHGSLPEDIQTSAFFPQEVTPNRIAAFEAAGGFAAANEALAPYRLSGAPDFVPPKRSFVRAELPGLVKTAESLTEAEEALRPYLLGERNVAMVTGASAPLFAALLIPSGYGEPDGPIAQYWSLNLTDNSLQDVMASSLESALQKSAIVRFGLPSETYDELASISPRLNSFRPDRASENAEISTRDRIETVMPAALTYMLLVIIFGAGNLLLTNTIEERSNKIVEVLLSSVTANQLMMGKLIGIAAVGLTMPTIFLVAGTTFSLLSAGEPGTLSIVINYLLSSPLPFIYLFYFFCAYSIFAMIFLAIGAVSNSLQDAQSYMGPLMLIVFAPLPFMILVFQNPNGLAASILTWIPIYTPYAVMMRAASSPPMWEVVGATILMLVFAFVLARYMGAIFRNSILQAAPTKAGDIFKILRRRSTP